MEALPGLTIVIPAHNAKRQLPSCLQALRSSQFRDFEIIVVDDCSTDDPQEVIRSYGATYLRTRRRLGPAGSRNLGAEHARGSVLVFIDSDVVVSPDTLQMVTDDFKQDPELAAVFGSYDRAPAEPGFFSQYKNIIHHYVHQNSNPRAVTFWAGCGAIRTAVFRSFGFDADRYPRPSIEDIELGLRLRRAGHTILLDKRIQVTHLKRWTFTGILKSDIRDRAIPWAKLILETGEMPADLNLGHKSRLSAAITLLLAAAFALLPPLSARLGKLSLGLATLGVASSLVLLIVLNHGVYRFFREQRGIAFMIAAMPLHWLYYFYSGVVWICCSASHYLGKPFRMARSQMSGRRTKGSSPRASESAAVPVHDWELCALDLHRESAPTQGQGNAPSPGDVVVIGAGPAGLTAAYELSKHGRYAVVLESDNVVGGIARTVDYKGYLFDIGGHRFFSKWDEVNQIWREILGDKFLERQRSSRILYRNRFFLYPLKIGGRTARHGLCREPANCSQLCVRGPLSFSRGRDSGTLGLQPIRRPPVPGFFQDLHREGLGCAVQRDPCGLGCTAHQGPVISLRDPERHFSKPRQSGQEPDLQLPLSRTGAGTNVGDSGRTAAAVRPVHIAWAPRRPPMS